MTPVRRLASFSRYSIPNTESDLPAVRANSCDANGVRRANACSTRTRVFSPADEKRGKSWKRVNSKSGAAAGV